MIYYVLDRQVWNAVFQTQLAPMYKYQVFLLQFYVVLNQMVICNWTVKILFIFHVIG